MPPAPAVALATEKLLLSATKAPTASDGNLQTFPWIVADSYLILVEQNKKLSLKGYTKNIAEDSQFINDLRLVKNAYLKIASKGRFLTYRLTPEDIRKLYEGGIANPPVIKDITFIPDITIEHGTRYDINLSFQGTDNKMYSWSLEDFIPKSAPGKPTVNYVATSQETVNMLVTLSSENGGEDPTMINLDYFDATGTGTIISNSYTISSLQRNHTNAYIIPLSSLVNMNKYTYSVSVTNSHSTSDDFTGVFSPTDTPNITSIVSVNGNGATNAMDITFTPDETSYVNDIKMIGIKLEFTDSANANEKFTVYGQYNSNDTYTFSALRPTGAGTFPQVHKSYTVSVPYNNFKGNVTYELNVTMENTNGYGDVSATFSGVFVISAPGPIPATDAEFSLTRYNYLSYKDAWQATYTIIEILRSDQAKSTAWTNSYVNAYFNSYLETGVLTGAATAAANGTAAAVGGATIQDTNLAGGGGTIWGITIVNIKLFIGRILEKFLSNMYLFDNTLLAFGNVSGTTIIDAANFGVYKTFYSSTGPNTPSALATTATTAFIPFTPATALISTFNTSYTNLNGDIIAKSGTLTVKSPSQNWNPASYNSTTNPYINSIIEKGISFDLTSIAIFIINLAYTNYYESSPSTVLTRSQYYLAVEPYINTTFLTSLALNTTTVVDLNTKLNAINKTGLLSHIADFIDIMKLLIVNIVTLKISDMLRNKVPVLSASSTIQFPIEDQFIGIKYNIGLTPSIVYGSTTANGLETLIPITIFDSSIHPVMNAGFNMVNSNGDLIVTMPSLSMSRAWKYVKTTLELYSCPASTSTIGQSTSISVLTIPVNTDSFNLPDYTTGISIKQYQTNLILGEYYTAVPTFQFQSPVDESVFYNVVLGQSSIILLTENPSPPLFSSVVAKTVLQTDLNAALTISFAISNATSLKGNTITSENFYIIQSDLLPNNPTNAQINSYILSPSPTLIKTEFTPTNLSDSNLSNANSTLKYVDATKTHAFFTTSGLLFNTSYTVVGQIIGSNNNSLFSTFRGTTNIGAPGLVSGVTISLDNDKLNVNWTPATLTGGSPITQQIITLQDANSALIATKNVSALINNLSFSASDGLVLGTVYTVSIRSRNNTFTSSSVSSTSLKYSTQVIIGTIDFTSTQLVVPFNLNGSSISNLYVFYETDDGSSIYQVPNLHLINSSNTTLNVPKTLLSVNGKEPKSVLVVGSDNLNSMFFGSKLAPGFQ